MSDSAEKLTYLRFAAAQVDKESKELFKVNPTSPKPRSFLRRILGIPSDVIRSQGFNAAIEAINRANAAYQLALETQSLDVTEIGEGIDKKVVISGVLQNGKPITLTEQGLSSSEPVFGLGQSKIVRGQINGTQLPCGEATSLFRKYMTGITARQEHDRRQA